MLAEDIVKLQIAFDFGDLDDLIALAKRFGDDVDWIEVGTPLIVKESIRAVSAFKHSCPAKKIVADLKIVDAGAKEAELAFDAGADIVTVLGCAYDATIIGATQQAHAQQGQVMVDLMGVNDKPRRAREVEALGVDFICIHAGWDESQSSNDPLADLIAVKQATKVPLTIAGGMTVERLTQISRHGPHTIIVGRTVTLSPDPVAVAHQFHVRMLELDSERQFQ
jgi:3-hexulose-6-phosphate synthase